MRAGGHPRIQQGDNVAELLLGDDSREGILHPRLVSTRPLPCSSHVGASESIGHPVGSVVATDPDTGDVLSYSITRGNEAGHFAIVADGNSRQIMVARVLSDEAPAKYALTVGASEGTRFGASVAVDGDTYRHQA